MVVVVDVGGAVVVVVDVDMEVTTVVVVAGVALSPDPLHAAAARTHAIARTHDLTREGR